MSTYCKKCGNQLDEEIREMVLERMKEQLEKLRKEDVDIYDIESVEIVKAVITAFEEK